MIAILGMDDGMIRFYNNVERVRMMVHMQLYRGSNEVVTQPDVLCLRRGLDFGAGFYTMTDLDQAVSFSKKVALKRKGRPVVSVYEFDEGPSTT